MDINHLLNIVRACREGMGSRLRSNRNYSSSLSRIEEFEPVKIVSILNMQ